MLNSVVVLQANEEVVFGCGVLLECVCVCVCEIERERNGVQVKCNNLSSI